MRNFLLNPIDIFANANKTSRRLLRTIIPNAAERQKASQCRLAAVTYNQSGALCTAAHIESAIFGAEIVIDNAVQMWVDLLAFAVAQNTLGAVVEFLRNRALSVDHGKSGNQANVTLG